MKKNCLFILSFLCLTLNICGCCSNKEAEQNRAKACGATMRVLMGAIEMYNMDNKSLMKELNEENYKILRSKGYIKNDFECVCPNTKKFQYSSTCDFSDPSFDIFTAIKCENHGTVKDIEQFIKK